MPKNTSRGPSYAGHVDVSSPDTAAPEWAELAIETNPPVVVEQSDPAGELVDVSRETVKPKPYRRRR